MITETLYQFGRQEGFIEPIQDRFSNIARRVDRGIYEIISIPREEQPQAIRLGIYTSAAYLALC